VGGVGTDMGSATDLAAAIPANASWRREDRALLMTALRFARTGLFGPLMPLIIDKNGLQGAKDQRSSFAGARTAGSVGVCRVGMHVVPPGQRIKRELPLSPAVGSAWLLDGPVARPFSRLFF
jgi:hypothetical protein